MRHRFSAIAVLLLLLVQPATALAGDFGPQAQKGAGPAKNAREGLSAPALPASMFSVPQDTPEDIMLCPRPSERSLHVIEPVGCGTRMLLPGAGTHVLASMDGPLPDIVHRGELELERMRPSMACPLLAFGPNTPPPANGDWIVDKPGNNVNNTTVVLNGWLNVTAGDLALDNVTLIMNCAFDGQFGINVSAGATLNATNCNITAFNGSFHYKFTVFGPMFVDRCNVSEMWGNPDHPFEGAGIAVFSSTTRILSSIIYNGETNGFQVHGYAGFNITDSVFRNNGRNGFSSLDNTSGRISRSVFCDNAGNGLATFGCQRTAFDNSTSTRNNGSGVLVFGNSSASFEYCTLSHNIEFGAAVQNSSSPVFLNCDCLSNGYSGIVVNENARRPKFINCTSSGNGEGGFFTVHNSTPFFKDCESTENVQHGILVRNDSTPEFTECSSLNNLDCGIVAFGASIPIFTNCTSEGNALHGIGTGESTCATFTRCVSEGNGESGLLAANESNPYLSDCTFISNRMMGISIRDNSSATVVMSNVELNGRGIQTTEYSRPNFTCTTSRNNRETGVALFSWSDATFFECEISDNTICGVFTTDSVSSCFTDCTSVFNNGSGFSMTGYSHPCLTNCTSSNNTAHGFLISGHDSESRPTLADCTATYNNNSGLQAESGANPTVRGGAFNNNSDHGIAVWNAAGEYTGCRMIGNKEVGIATVVVGLEPGTKYAPIFKNTICDRNFVGIAVYDNSSSRFSNCNVSNNSLHGIQISDWANPEFDNCTSSDNDRHGAFVRGNSSSFFRDCKMIDNHQNGIQTDDSPDLTVAHCSFINNKGGIVIGNNATGCLNDSAIINNSENGVLIGGFAEPSIKGCTSTGNNWSGIAVGDEAKPSISDCIAAGNSMSGIAVSVSSSPDFSNCSATDSPYGIWVSGKAHPAFSDCLATRNNVSGIMILDNSTPAFSRCPSVGNYRNGLMVNDEARPCIECLDISDNVFLNLWVSSTKSVIVANSTLGGESTLDMQLIKSSLLILRNTTFSKKALVRDDAQLMVQWYVALKLLDRANNPLAGAVVEGTEWNGSVVLSPPSDPYGCVNELPVTEYIQNSSDSPFEFTYYGPYDFNVTRDGEFNITQNIPVHANVFRTLYFDFAPRITPLSDLTVKEDSPYQFNMTPYLSDPDNSLEIIGIRTDRDYIAVDNASKCLKIDCPIPLGTDIVNITVSDGLKNRAQTMAILVAPQNDPPRCIVPIPDHTVFEDRTIELDLTCYFMDEESGTQLKFRCSDRKITINDMTKKASWTPGDGNSSLFDVIINASDGFLGVDSNPFDIIFNAVNEPPVYVGGLADENVLEHRNWTIDLDDYFTDEETPLGMRYDSSNSEVVVNQNTRKAIWAPGGNTTYNIEVFFTAHDSENFSSTAESPAIRLTYIPVNDAPRYIGKIQDAHIKLGAEWCITLEDYFADEDSSSLVFSVSNPAVVKIIEVDKTKHYAVWKPRRGDSNLTGIVFGAYDGNSRAASGPVNMSFDASPETGPEVSPITRIIQSIPWYFYILLIVAAAAGVSAFYTFRRIKYGKCEIEQLFLIYNDGRLIAHCQRKDTDQVSNELLTGMLTALKGFIKESLKDQKKGELDEMKYGDLKIALEHGENVYLAAFISGYVTDRLKDGMRGVLKKVEDEYGYLLPTWDGMMAEVEGSGAFLDELMGAHEPKEGQPK